jgi:hypothetical protein
VDGITVKDKRKNVEQGGEVDGFALMIKIEKKQIINKVFVNIKNSKLIIIFIKK